jgi:predicted HicB family RNase H-like nuclease
MEKKVKFIATIPGNVHRALKIEAAQDATTMNALIVEILSKYLEKTRR